MFRFIFGFVFVTILVGCGGSKPVLDDADQALVKARSAIADGNTESAMKLLDQSIALKPDTWSYFERAKLHAEADNDAEAKADIGAGLEIEPEHSELLWLQKQLKKSKNNRFKGTSGQPPSVSK